MKIHINLLKSWFKSEINEEKLVQTLTNLGFESLLDQEILDISIPTNRTDCTGLITILNELSKFYEIDNINKYNINNTIKNDIKVQIKEKEFCPKYLYIIAKEINNNIETPKEIITHLNLNNIKNNNFITDIINYTTLITGQPLHAYDKDNIGNTIFIEKTKKKVYI